jgi:hypothetical protein
VRKQSRLGIAYLLLLLAHTVQNFSLKSVGAGSPGFWLCVAIIGELSSAPSRPMIVVSGTSSGGGGGGGGCARRLGSVDMASGVADLCERVLGRSEVDAGFACEDGCFATKDLLKLELHNRMSLHSDKPAHGCCHNAMFVKASKISSLTHHFCLHVR